MDRHQARRVAYDRGIEDDLDCLRVPLRRSRRAVGGFPGLSRSEPVGLEDQPFGAGIIVVAEIALALELQRLVVGIGGGCGLDEAAAQRMHGMWVEVGREVR